MLKHTMFTLALLAIGISPATAQSLSSLAPIAPIKRSGPGDPNCAKPEWPKSSLRNEEQGTVTLSYLIDVDGSILDSKIVRTSGFRELDLAAYTAIAKCNFVLPADAKEPRWMQLRYVWTLQ